MKFSSALRCLSDHHLKQGMRGNYYASLRTLSRLRQLVKSSNHHLLMQLLKEFRQYMCDSVEPVEGETLDRAGAAVRWILRAQAATSDAGVSLGYFPLEGGWKVSYPETTGYIIPTLLEYAARVGDETARTAALQMACWEVQIQMKSGAVQAGPVCPPEERIPAVFNTGMVLQGWLAAYRASHNIVFLEAGQRAADFLLGDLGTDGHFRTHGRFVTPDHIKTYTVLCAWALFGLGEDTCEHRYQDAALKIAEAALLQQRPNGWFDNNCLSNNEAPLLHTIGYTLQGILEVGHLTGRGDLINAVRKGADPIIGDISEKGFLHGCYYSDWEPALFSSCLPGSAQLAVVCFRLYEITGLVQYRFAGDRILNYLKALQVLDWPDPSLNGALSGSFPLLGSYMTCGYPNWATKYFLDGLLLQDRIGKRTPERTFIKRALEIKVGPSI